MIEAKKVLVVDDQPEVRAAAARWLAREGFEVEVAASAEEALSALSRGTPDVVCLDVELPGMNGMEALERMLRLQPGLRVLVLSGHDEREMGLDAARRGAAGFVGKPFNRSQLGAAVRAAIETGAQPYSAR